MKTMKKIVAILAVALMLCSILPLSVFAADAETIKYTISNYPAGTQYKTETHELDDYLTIYTNTRCHFTTELRIYAPNGGVNGEVILASTRELTTVVLNAGNKASTLTVSTSPDNSTWTQHSTLSVASSYKDLSISNLPAGTKYIKLVNGSGQVRIKYITVSYAADAPAEPEVPSACEHANAVYTHDCQPTVCPDCEEELPAKADHSYNENVTLAPTCTTAGEKTLTCACGDVKTETVKALGHNWVDGACDVCGEVKPLEATIDFSTKDQRTEYSTTTQKWENDGLTLTNNKGDSTSNVGDYANPVRIYKSSEIIISYEGMTKLVIDANGISSNGDWKATLADYSYTVENNVYTITFAKPTDSITLTAAAQVRANSITAYGATPSDCEHDYVGVETQAPTCSAEGVMTYTCSKCQESYTEAIAVIDHNYVADIIDATCTTTGTATYECSVCFHSYDETIPMKAHNYVDDVCADCGHVKAYKGAIDFSNAEQRTELTTQIQIWANEGLTFTNNKLTGNNIADYTDPIRIYKNSGIVIEFPEMSKLIIDASGVGNDYLWDATLEAAGLSFTVENKIYTITFAEPVNSIELTAANQVRANSITAVVAHECTYDSVVTDPTCVNGGYTTNTCTKCGDSNVSDATEALGHTYAHDFDVDCDVCGTVRAVAGPISYEGMSVSNDCNGLAMLFKANVEGIAVKAGTFVQADFTNATYNDYKLLGLGVIASNGKSETTIEGVRMYDLDVENGVAMFAFRIINIPADKLGTTITMTPYYIVEIDGVATTIYGEAQTGSYADIAG